MQETYNFKYMSPSIFQPIKIRDAPRCDATVWNSGTEVSDEPGLQRTECLIPKYNILPAHPRENLKPNMGLLFWA
jgi:hypothetical protein